MVMISNAREEVTARVLTLVIGGDAGRGENTGASDTGQPEGCPASATIDYVRVLPLYGVLTYDNKKDALGVCVANALPGSHAQHPFCEVRGNDNHTRHNGASIFHCAWGCDMATPCNYGHIATLQKCSLLNVQPNRVTFRNAVNQNVNLHSAQYSAKGSDLKSAPTL